MISNTLTAFTVCRPSLVPTPHHFFLKSPVFDCRRISTSLPVKDFLFLPNEERRLRLDWIPRLKTGSLLPKGGTETASSSEISSSLSSLRDSRRASESIFVVLKTQTPRCLRFGSGRCNFLLSDSVLTYRKQNEKKTREQQAQLVVLSGLFIGKERAQCSHAGGCFFKVFRRGGFHSFFWISHERFDQSFRTYKYASPSHHKPSFLLFLRLKMSRKEKPQVDLPHFVSQSHEYLLPSFSFSVS